MRSSKPRLPADRPAVVLVGHGSKARGFDAAMRRVASALRKDPRYQKVLCAFLEVSSPSIPEAVSACVRQGAREVRVLPYFVLTGKHVIRDIPEIVREAARFHRGSARIVLCPYLGFDARIVAVVKQRIKERP